jgi:hypothetical protein
VAGAGVVDPHRGNGQSKNTACFTQPVRLLSPRSPIILQRVKMKKLDIRRAIIREWMALPSDQRLNEEQAASFATAVISRYELPRSRRSPQEVIMGWLLARKAKST